MITLQNDKLFVTIPEPGKAPNTSLRFDRAGFIADVMLDGHSFCASEPRNLSHPTSGGRGLCDEWLLDVSGEAAIGEYFPKFGVGLIRKEEDYKYVFHRAYKDVKPFPVEISSTDTEAEFTTLPVPCLGYALKSVRKVTVEDNTITVTVTAENTGEKPLALKEFCHNFLSIDGMALGSDYHLSLPGIPDLGTKRLYNRSGKYGSMRGEGKGLTLCEFSAIDTDIAFEPDELEKSDAFTWTLSHEGAGLFVHGEDFYQPAKFCVWAVDHIISPEISVGFALLPGERFTWKRRWHFGYCGERL